MQDQGCARGLCTCLQVAAGPDLALRTISPKSAAEVSTAECRGLQPHQVGLLRSSWPPGSSWTVSPSSRMEAHGWGCDLKIFNLELQFPGPHPQ